MLYKCIPSSLHEQLASRIDAVRKDKRPRRSLRTGWVHGTTADSGNGLTFCDEA